MSDSEQPPSEPPEPPEEAPGTPGTPEETPGTPGNSEAPGNPEQSGSQEPQEPSGTQGNPKSQPPSDSAGHTEPPEEPAADTSEPAEQPSYKLLLVTGSHLRAEAADRPLAYHLQAKIEDWLVKHDPYLNVHIDPIVCSDIWFLNNQELQRRPVICIGGPGVNALSAYFAKFIPEDEEIMNEPRVLIQIDPEFTDLHACIWGTNHELTRKGLELFTDQYLDEYMKAVANQVEPDVE